eukprot:Gb_00233 [translate_table: standard]
MLELMHLISCFASERVDILLNYSSIEELKTENSLTTCWALSQTIRHKESYNKQDNPFIGRDDQEKLMYGCGQQAGRSGPQESASENGGLFDNQVRADGHPNSLLEEHSACIFFQRDFDSDRTYIRMVHIDSFAAMNGISRFCEKGFPWRYSKEEDLSVEEIIARNFTYLIKCDIYS